MSVIVRNAKVGDIYGFYGFYNSGSFEGYYSSLVKVVSVKEKYIDVTYCDDEGVIPLDGKILHRFSRIHGGEIKSPDVKFLSNRASLQTADSYFEHKRMKQLEKISYETVAKFKEMEKECRRGMDEGKLAILLKCLDEVKAYEERNKK